MIKVKICCIANMREARLAIEGGAYALGLVAQMPSGPGVISDEAITHVADRIPGSIKSFLLSSRTRVPDLIAHLKATRCNTLQIVDKLTKGSHSELKDALPDVDIVQVIHVRDKGSIEEALKLEHEVDALLLDSGAPDGKTKILGGTGKTHDWTLSRQIVDKVGIPVFLAGGLNSQNIEAAIDQVRPYGVDLCSGVRTSGRLNPFKLEAFFKAVQRAS